MMDAAAAAAAERSAELTAPFDPSALPPTPFSALLKGVLSNRSQLGQGQLGFLAHVPRSLATTNKYPAPG